MLRDSHPRPGSDDRGPDSRVTVELEESCHMKTHQGVTQGLWVTGAVDGSKGRVNVCSMDQGHGELVTRANAGPQRKEGGDNGQQCVI